MSLNLDEIWAPQGHLLNSAYCRLPSLKGHLYGGVFRSTLQQRSTQIAEFSHQLADHTVMGKLSLFQGLLFASQKH